MYTYKNDFFNPHKIALSGQAFRVDIIDSTHVELVARGRYLQIATLGNDEFALSCDQTEFDQIWRDYFDFETDYNEIIKSTPAADQYLQDAIAYSHGIRILRQEPFEMLMSYIISQRRSIPSIKTAVNKLSSKYGKSITLPRLAPPFVSPLRPATTYHAFPTVDDLIGVTEHDFAEFGVGYRAAYLNSAVTSILNGTFDIDNASFNSLKALHGVGDKVANCVMLFGYHQVDAFPVDVWIQRIIDKYYNGSIDTSPYSEHAGIMQQFMFYYERMRP